MCCSCLTRCLPRVRVVLLFFFFNDTATTEIYTLSLHDALPIFLLARAARAADHVAHGGEAHDLAARDPPGLLDDPRKGAVLPVRLDLDLPQHALWEVQALLLLVGSRHQVLPLDYWQESLNLEGLQSNFQTRAPLAVTCPCATRTWSAFTSSLLGEPCSSARGFWLSTRRSNPTAAPHPTSARLVQKDSVGTQPLPCRSVLLAARSVL